MTEHYLRKKSRSSIPITAEDLEKVNKMWSERNQTSHKGKRELLRRQR